MKRKLIEVKQTQIIKCDNIYCDFVVPYSEEAEKHILLYINQECPKCGHNLLTKDDYLRYLRVKTIINWLNKWFSWTTYFYSQKSWDKRKTMILKTHKEITITDN